MPELPEVETICRGIAPHLQGVRILALNVRQPRLRWPITEELVTQVIGAKIRIVKRRAKYLLLELDHGTIILHLGMSGSLRILSIHEPPQKHDHFDLVLEREQCLRMRDPRRFGALLWHDESAETHTLLQNIGPEPLESNFDGAYLVKAAIGRRMAIKSFIMDSKIVAGVGNIYASEALFLAGIHPLQPCQSITIVDYDKLVSTIKQVLTQAIEQGGTTLRDFSHADGTPGYFANFLHVYGRAGEPCLRCSTPIQSLRIGQRASFFCPSCQG